MMDTTVAPEQIPWRPTHHAFELAHQYFIICIVFMTIAGLFIIARIWTRCRAGFMLGADDYLSIVAFVSGTSLLDGNHHVLIVYRLLS